MPFSISARGNKENQTIKIFRINSNGSPAQKKHIQFTDRLTSKNQTSYIQNNTLSTPPRPAILRGATLRWRGARPVEKCVLWERFYSVGGTSAQAEPLTRRHQAAPRLNQNPVFCIIQGRKTLGEFSSPELQAPFGIQNMGFAPIVHPKDRRRASGLISLFRFFSPRYHQVFI